MSADLSHKPAYDEWSRWMEVLTDRLTEVAHVYSAPPYPDAYLLEGTHQEKIGEVVGLLRSIHGLMEGNTGFSTTVAGDEATLRSLQPLAEEALALLPTFSTDMQFLLKSPWFENCTGKTATSLFCGPRGDLNEGIGSGHPIHGRLPEVLSALLEREQMGGERPARAPTSVEAPSRAPLRRTASYGSAGRVD